MKTDWSGARSPDLSLNLQEIQDNNDQSIQMTDNSIDMSDRSQFGAVSSNSGRNMLSDLLPSKSFNVKSKFQKHDKKV